jgi:hypothetical protein
MNTGCNQNQPTYDSQSVAGKLAGADIGQYRRQNHIDTLDDLISYYRLRVNQLEALQRSLPRELPIGAEEVLVEALRNGV